MRIATDLVEGLRYKLRMFGIPIQGETNVFCDNRGVVLSTAKPKARLNKKHNAICFHRVREAVARGMIRIGKEKGETNIADLLPKVLNTPRRRFLLQQIYRKEGSVKDDDTKKRAGSS